MIIVNKDYQKKVQQLSQYRYDGVGMQNGSHTWPALAEDITGDCWVAAG